MNHDVVLVGGGIVGTTLACALGQAGIRVGVVEARPFAEAPLSDLPDLRVSALTRASERILAAVGARHRLDDRRLGVFREMRVWDAPGAGSIHFDGADVGLSHLGLVVENRAIEAALEASAMELDTVRWYRPERVTDLQRDDTGATLRLEHGTARGRLAVGADGAQSLLRTLAGIEPTRSDYGQDALVATLKPELSHRDTAWQRFLPSGPLAYLPLADERVSIVWSTTPDQAAELLRMSERAFEGAVAEAFEHRLGAVALLGDRRSFHLERMSVPRYVDDRIALIGDAAHTIHPLAGQGLNLGLLDAAALAEES